MNGPYHSKMSENYIAVPPGATIEEQIEDCNMTKQEFVEKMGMSERFIDELIDGNILLTNEIAMKLEEVLGVDAFYWSGLERRYREDLEKVNRENKRAEKAKRRWRYGTSSAKGGSLAYGRV